MKRLLMTLSAAKFRLKADLGIVNRPRITDCILDRRDFSHIAAIRLERVEEKDIADLG